MEENDIIPKCSESRYQKRKEEEDAILKKKKKNVLFIIEDWNEKVESQDIPGVTGKFGLGVQNEAEQR